MSRKRLSWIYKTADPYEMNQDRDQRDTEDYMIGDPSAFAEDPHDDLPDDEALGRNEVGFPNIPDSTFGHKDVEEWNSGDSYDNADTFSPDDRDRQASSMSRESARDVYARLEKKAYQCVKIASNLLPDASEEVVEEQAFDLMSLPDEAVIATALRLTEEGESLSEDTTVDSSDEWDLEEEEKDVDAMLDEMLEEENIALAEDDEEEEEEDDDEESEEGKEKEEEEDKKESMPNDDVDAMIDEMMGEPEQVADATDQLNAPQPHQPQSQQAPQPDGPQQVQMGQGHAGMDFDLSNDQNINADAEDFQVEMEPTMDMVNSNSIEEDDEVLQNLFAHKIPEEARENSDVSTPVQEGQTREASQSDSREGVTTLGGRVKEATDQGGGDDSDLAKLWESDPDVSDVF